jgi:hypothetical protein
MVLTGSKYVVLLTSFVETLVSEIKLVEFESEGEN